MPDEYDDKIADMNILRVPTKLADRTAAELQASVFVEERFAPCVKILQPCHLVCRWLGGIEKSSVISKFIASQIARARPDYHTRIAAELQA